MKLKYEGPAVTVNIKPKPLRVVDGDTVDVPTEQAKMLADLPGFTKIKSQSSGSKTTKGKTTKTKPADTESDGGTTT